MRNAIELSCRLEPANRICIARVVPQVFKWRFHVRVEPVSQLTERVIFIVSELFRHPELTCSTKQPRRNMRVFVNGSADKSDERDLVQIESSFFILID
jgi:hypothetical protein